VSAMYILPPIKKQSEKLISSLRGHYIDPSDFGQVVVAAAASATLPTWGYFSTWYSTDGPALLCECGHSQLQLGALDTVVATGIDTKSHARPSRNNSRVMYIEPREVR